MAKTNWHKFIRIPDRRPPWAWAEETLQLKNSPFGNKFNPALTPWLKEPSEVFTDNRVKEITCQCCVQGGKTILMQVSAGWAIRFSPAPMMFNCQTDDDAKEFARERLMPMLESCPDIASRIPEDKTKKSVCSISFPEMFILIQGANLSNLQSKSIRWLFNDEVFLWKVGLLDHARKRTTQFWNRRIFNASTAGDEGADLDLAYKAGDQRVWHLQCPSCGALSNPKWARVQIPESDDFETVKRLTRYVCEHCQSGIEHTERNHKVMNAGGRYVATNPRPTPGHVSFNWNALCLSPSVLSWGDLAVEWRKANEELKRGNLALLKEFVTKRLAESWDANLASGSRVEISEADYSPEKSWPDEAFRFMTVDVQMDHFWFVIRAWGKDGESRLLQFGKALSWQELRNIQTQWRVKDHLAFIDCGYEDQKVYEQCVTYGWCAMRGDDRRDFPHPLKNGKQVRRIYSIQGRGDPGAGTISQGRRFAPVFNWSNWAAKNILARLRDGKGVKWVVPVGIEPAYHEHMHSEMKREVVNKVTGISKWQWVKIGRRPNHLWDCECMQVVAATMAGLIGEIDLTEPAKS